jgi:hypothetical protein
VLPALLLLVAAAGGAALYAALEPPAGRIERLCAGTALGLTLAPLAGFALARLLGSLPVSTLLAAGLLVLPVFAVGRRAWAPGSGGRPTLAGILAAAIAAAVLLLTFDRAFFTRADGIYTGVEHNLGDLPFHLAVITGFAWGGNLGPEHPELSGARLTYPFLVDFGAAQLVGLGASLRAAVGLQNAALALALLGLLHRFTRELTADRVAARLALPLFFLSGGLGFLWLLRDVALSEAPLDLLTRLPQDYTITRTGELRWGNVLTTLLLPQRALLLGLPVALIAWTLLWRALDPEAPQHHTRRRLVVAGLITGLLPLAHAHAYAVVIAVAGALGLLFPPRGRWAAFFAPALLLGVPQVLWLTHGSSVGFGRFLAFEVGWDSGPHHPLLFWLVNAGLFLPLALVAHLRLADRRLARFLLPAWGLFLAPNLLRLSPWIWDNVKVLLFWFVALVPVVALALARLASRGGLRRLAALGLLLVLTLSGGLDVYRVVSRQIALRIFDERAIAFAEEVRRATPPRALILHAPGYDSPVYLTGRRSVLGYPGHIWSQGLEQGAREAEIARIYAGEPDAEALLARFGVDHVLVGPSERALLKPNTAFLERFPIVLKAGDYELRRVAPR